MRRLSSGVFIGVRRLAPFSTHTAFLGSPIQPVRHDYFSVYFGRQGIYLSDRVRPEPFCTIGVAGSKRDQPTTSGVAVSTRKRRFLRIPKELVGGGNRSRTTLPSPGILSPIQMLQGTQILRNSPIHEQIWNVVLAGVGSGSVPSVTLSVTFLLAAP